MENKIDWFSEIINGLRKYPDGFIWTNGTEILCKTEDILSSIVDLFQNLYRSQGQDITVNTGYYDPEEDERNSEIDECTGWWFIDIT